MRTYWSDIAYKRCSTIDEETCPNCNIQEYKNQKEHLNSCNICSRSEVTGRKSSARNATRPTKRLAQSATSRNAVRKTSCHSVQLLLSIRHTLLRVHFLRSIHFRDMVASKPGVRISTYGTRVKSTSRRPWTRQSSKPA